MLLGAAAAVAALLVSAAPASAVNRYAHPDGSGSAPCTDNVPVTDACSLQNAFIALQDGDDLTLNSGGGIGNYSTLIELSINQQATVHGSAPGVPATVISSAANIAVSMSTGSVLRDVRVVHTGPAGSFGLRMGDNTLAERVAVDDGATLQHSCSVGGTGATIRDSVCWNRSVGGSAVHAEYDGGFTFDLNLRNVTAVATANSADGIALDVSEPSTKATVHATNVIADGAGADAFAQSDGSFGTEARIVLGYSNSNIRSTTGVGAVIENGPTNTSTPPVYENGGVGDFDQVATSTGTIDRGNAGIVNGVGLGPFALDGAARCLGAAPDIGADEFPGAACPVPPVTLTPTETGQRAAALKKCKKKKTKKAKKKCRKKAQKLPV